MCELDGLESCSLAWEGGVHAPTFGLFSSMYYFLRCLVKC
jgi:hypothetical protein